ncbi:MAG: PDZ domain-containing protein [Bacteroidota bacterium]
MNQVVELRSAVIVMLLLHLLVVGLIAQTSGKPKQRENACAEVTLAIQSQGKEEIAKGIVVDRDGFIMTAARPVRTADEIIVYFVDGSVQYADVYAANKIADVAMLKVEALPSKSCVIKIKKPEYLKAGSSIAGAVEDQLQLSTIAEYFSEQSSISEDPRKEYYLLDQGGQYTVGTPIYDLSGRFVGLVSDTLRTRIKVCATVQIAKRKLMDFVSFWTGADVQLIDISNLNTGHKTGFSIRKLSSKSALAAEGIRPGDVIIDIDGNTASNIDELEQLYQQFKASNGIVTIHYMRDGRVREAEVDMN